MSLAKLTEMGRAEGLSASDVADLHRNGLTLGTAEQSKAMLGIGLAGLLQLLQQFGPTFLTILTTLLSLAKTPNTPAPTPAPEPTPTPPVAS